MKEAKTVEGLWDEVTALKKKVKEMEKLIKILVDATVKHIYPPQRNDRSTPRGTSVEELRKHLQK